MKILMINTVYSVGSTGKIVGQIEKIATKAGHECMIAHRYAEEAHQYSENCVAVSAWLDCHIHNRIARYTMLNGFFSRIKTCMFLRKVKEFKPDIIHIHNIHGNFINIPLLFRYIKKHKVSVVWTLHDCWPFTGNCFYFDAVACNKWKTKCHQCPQKGSAIFDLSSFLFEHKMRTFVGVEKLTIVTPSKWLKHQVEESFLKNYPIRVINNGIDLSVFKPRNSDFRKKYCCEQKVILLGVALCWNYRKGLDVFIDLAKRLDSKFQIVLVGTNETVDRQLPNNIISIHRTHSPIELAEIYTASDIFINPTRDDNYPTVNMEALACGTPVITFRSGGSQETIDDTCGCAVEGNDIDSLVKRIKQVWEQRLYAKENCLKKAKDFNMYDRFDEYVCLFEDLL